MYNTLSLVPFPSIIPQTRETGGRRRRSKKAQKYSVILNVYDAPNTSTLNRRLYSLGFGRYLSTVTVHNWEYAFLEDTDGIRRSQPGTIANEKQLMLRKTIVIGYTDKDDEEVQMVKESLRTVLLFGRSTEYNGITKNCNHFSDKFCHELTGKGIPKWVNRIKFTSFVEGFLNRPPGPPLREEDVAPTGPPPPEEDVTL